MQPIDFDYRAAVPDGRVQFLMADVPLIDVAVRSGWAAVTESRQRMQELGLDAVSEGMSGSRRSRVWVRLQDGDDTLQRTGVRHLAWEGVFAADVQVEMLRNCQMFVGVHEVQRFTNWADRRFPELGKEVGRTVTLPRLTAVVQRLVREGVALRNARQLLETTLEWAPKEKDPDVIADYVRLAYRRQLCHEASAGGLIEVVLLSPELEDRLRSAMKATSQGSYLELEPDLEQDILNRLGQLSGTGGTPDTPPVLVTAADLRRAVRNLIEDEFFAVQVFAYSELTTHLRVQPVGMIEV